jgi:hypothetical protein
MTRLKIASALTLAVLATTMWGQTANAQANPQDHEAHHPDGSAAQPAAPPTPSAPPAMGQQQQGMMGGMNMMGMMSNMPEMMRMMGMMRGMGGMSTIDRVEGRIAFLRAELKITDAQASAFADALRGNAQKLGAMRSAMMMPQPGATAPQTLADRLDAQERWLAARLEGTRAIKAAFVPLYGALSDEQKKTANDLLAPHMGMGIAMMSGPMGPGQIGSGQMSPGPMGPGQMGPGRMGPAPAPR